MLKHIKQYGYSYTVLVALVCLTIYKWADFYLPYFWDELCVYGSGAVYMAKNGISLLPSGLPPEISRGHPLLFYALSALFERIAHYNVFIVHLCEYGVFVSCIIFIFVSVQKVYSSSTAAITSFIFLIQPVVIAQCGFVLPETMLAFFCWGAIWCFSVQKWGGYFLFGSLAILVKESAVIIPVALVVSYIIMVLTKRSAYTFRLKDILILLLPLGVLGLFFIIQKQQNGWYIFPFHEKLLVNNADDFYKGVLSFKGFMILEQNRYIYPYILLAGLLLFVYMRLARKVKFSVHPLAITSIVFFIFYFLFSAANPINERYILPMLIPFSLWVALSIRQIFNKYHQVAVLFCLGCVAFQSKVVDPGFFAFDVNESYKYAASTEYKATDYIINNLKAKYVISTFPMNFALESKDEGYPDGDIHTADFNDTATYLITSYPSAPYTIPDSIKTDTITTYKEGNMAVHILKIKGKN